MLVEEENMYEQLEYELFSKQDYSIAGNLKPFEVREQIRQSTVFRDFIFRWNHGNYNTKRQVGSLMEAMKAYVSTTQSPNREDWHNYYFTHVRTEKQIVELVQGMQWGTGLQDFGTALNYWYIHILDSTFTGMLSEIEAFEAITQWAEENHKAVNLRYATDEEDRVGGVDIIITCSETGAVLLGVQVKTKAYFNSTRETVVAAREGYNPPKYRKFKEQTGAEVWYFNINAYREHGVLNANVWWKALSE